MNYLDSLFDKSFGVVKRRRKSIINKCKKVPFTYLILRPTGVKVFFKIFRLGTSYTVMSNNDCQSSPVHFSPDPLDGLVYNFIPGDRQSVLPVPLRSDGTLPFNGLRVLTQTSYSFPLVNKENRKMRTVSVQENPS